MSIDSIPAWEWLWVVYSTFSAILHAVIIYIILENRRLGHKSFFTGSFFLICVIQGFQEIAMYLTTTFVNRFRKYRIILYEVSSNNQVVEWEYYWFIFTRNNLYVGHILVALNRLSAFYFTSPNSYARFWNTSTVYFLFGIGYLVSLVSRGITLTHNVTFATKVDNVSDIFGFTPNPFVDKVDTLTEIIMSLGTAIFCIIAYSITGIIAKKRMFLLHDRNKKREAVLLRCAIATFLMLIPPALRSILHLTALVSQNPTLQQWTARQQAMTTEAMFVFQPILLIVTCPQLRERIWNLMFPMDSNIVTTISTTGTAFTNQSSTDYR